MALVLRKAVLPKNVSLLKCWKGRPLATASNKKTVAPLSSAAAHRSYKSKFFPSAFPKIRKTKKLVPIKFRSNRNKTNPVWVSSSCPNFVANGKQMSKRCFSSTTNSKTINQSHYWPRNYIQLRSYSKVCNAGCPCPFPCGPCGCKDGCNCLPPPCNTPAKCLQYMTGYYYYPYGTWFCGPYHVAGTCCPVGSKCPCPCPCPKCCACVFPPADLGAEKKINQYKLNPDIHAFPGEAPCQIKSPKPSGTSISKIFNFNTPEQKNPDPKPTKKHVPPVLASLICPNLSTVGSPHISNNNIYSSYPITYSKSKSNSYHTITNLISTKQSFKPPNLDRRKGSRVIYFQKRYKVTRPLEFPYIVRDKDPRNKQGSGYSSLPKYKRFNSKPHVDSDFKPYDL